MTSIGNAKVAGYSYFPLGNNGEAYPTFYPGKFYTDVLGFGISVLR